MERTQSLAQSRDWDVSIASRSFDDASHPTGGWLSANGSPGAVAGNNDFSQNTTARAGDGGTIVLAAQQHHVYQRGLASVNEGDRGNGSLATAGGNGGLIAVVANQDIIIQADTGNNAGVFQGNGGRGGQVRLTSGIVPSELGRPGGQGGLIAFSYNGQLNNQGGIIAKGGIGAHGAVVGSGWWPRV